MLVENDFDDQYFFMLALQEIHPGIRCEIANNGAEALDRVEDFPLFDIIFLDLNIPKIDGFECLESKCG